MKAKLLSIALLLAAGIIMTGCNQKKQYRPDARIVNSMNNKYPQATKVEWEQKQGYFSAEFRENGMETEAWFDKNGKWLMTETKLKYNMLPQAIRTNFEAGIYSKWKKDGIDKIERSGMQPVYIIEVEKEGQDTDLYYSEKGILVKTLNHADPNRVKGFLPVSADIREILKQKYPDANIIDIETKNGMQEIDILENGISKEVVFHNNTWKSTSREVSKAEVPTVVMDAYRHSEYGKYRIDDIYFFETPESSYYRFDLEQGNSEVKLNIDTMGKIIK